MSLQFIVHYSLHLIVPVVFSFLFFRPQWRYYSVLLLATMLVDLDHLLANPIFQADRCSIGYHYLHTLPAILFYCLMMFSKKEWVRVVGIGLLFHMCTDLIDCMFTFSKCHDCFENSALHPIVKTVEAWFQ